jgi:hypothetical protein
MIKGNEMTGNGNHLRINQPNIVHEEIDGETIILNLNSGNYYSIENVGADIWSYIEKGVPENEIMPLIFQNYECSQGDEENTVKSFLEQLKQEQLIVAINDQLKDPLLLQDWKDKITKRKNKLVFNIPVLNKYTDMQDLLLLDPIHEVDAAGWPSTKPSK